MGKRHWPPFPIVRYVWDIAAAHITKFSTSGTGMEYSALSSPNHTGSRFPMVSTTICRFLPFVFPSVHSTSFAVCHCFHALGINDSPHVQHLFVSFFTKCSSILSHSPLIWAHRYKLCTVEYGGRSWGNCLHLHPESTKYSTYIRQFPLASHAVARPRI